MAFGGLIFQTIPQLPRAPCHAHKVTPTGRPSIATTISNAATVLGVRRMLFLDSFLEAPTQTSRIPEDTLKPAVCSPWHSLCYPTPSEGAGSLGSTITEGRSQL